MAISVGSIILASDIRSKYSSFNTFINAYGGGVIAGVGSGPNVGDYAYASHINTLYNKLANFRSDEFLKT